MYIQGVSRSSSGKVKNVTIDGIVYMYNYVLIGIIDFWNE